MNQFQEYVTGQAFALSLSRRMCEAIQFIAINQCAKAAGCAVSMPEHIPIFATLNSLRERGLVEPKAAKLTEAGWLLYPVLEHAGLVATIKRKTSAA